MSFFNYIVETWFFVVLVLALGLYCLKEFLKYENRLDYTPLQFLGASILSFVYVLLFIGDKINGMFS